MRIPWTERDQQRWEWLTQVRPGKTPKHTKKGPGRKHAQGRPQKEATPEEAHAAYIAAKREFHPEVIF